MHTGVGVGVVGAGVVGPGVVGAAVVGVPFTHLTPASCPQVAVPIILAGQSTSLVSVPVHRTVSKKIRPAPLGKPVVRATGSADIIYNAVSHEKCMN
jgi:hypothetical protein